MQQRFRSHGRPVRLLPELVGDGIYRQLLPQEREDLLLVGDDLPGGIAEEGLEVLERHGHEFGGGLHALLCTCYDMFGCSERADKPGIRSRNIRRLYTGDAGLLERRIHRKQVTTAVSTGVRQWEVLVQRASVGLAAIHHFARTGKGSGKAYWQRHGIEKASTILGGRIAFGAVHLEPPLPAPDVAVFAARRGKRISPVDHFVEHGQAALVRLYRP